MRQISFWAREHYWSARLLIVLLKIILIAIAIFLGNKIKESGVILSAAFFFLPFGLLILVAITYPSKKEKQKHNKRPFYIRQKLFDTAAVTTCFVMIMFIAAYQNTAAFNTVSLASFSAKKIKQKPSAEEILNSLKYRDKKSITRTEKRVLKKELRKQVGVYITSKATGKNKDAEQAALIILVIIGAIALTGLLAALSCSIACGGGEGLAVIVGVLGLVAIIWLTVYLIKRINRKSKKKIAP
jgi:hypothetical protein